MKDLELLKNDEEYYRGVGKKYLSNSDIGTLLTNPKDFGKQSEDSVPFALGRYFHQLILEPEKAAEIQTVDASTRNTKIYKSALEELSVPLMLLDKEAEEVRGWVSTITDNLDFFDEIKAEGNEYEVPAIGEISGHMWKGKADIVGANAVYDLKTTSKIDDFRWNARKYNYDSQAYIYQTLFGKPLVFLVIDKTSGRLGRYECSEQFIQYGREKQEAAMEVYLRFFGDNPTEDINQFYITETL